jgi:hypothetical protein
MTTTENTTGYKSLVAAAAFTQGLRAKISSGQWAVAGATDKAVGVAQHACASGGVLTVKLLNAPGTFILQVSGAVTAGAQLYPTASGCVDDAGTTALTLVALEAATASGDLIECAIMQVGA